MVKVTIKWNREVLDDVEVDLTLPALVLKAQLCSLTGVPPARQKLMGLKGGPLKDDADMEAVGFKDGLKLTLFGTPEGDEISRNKARVLWDQALVEEGKLTDKSLQDQPSGLVNLGNTCYLSSVMQFFRPSKELTNIIKRFPDDLGEPNGDNKLCATFRKFFEAWDVTRDALPPFLIVEALRSHYPQFASKNPTGGGYAQQDAAECLSSVLMSFSKNSRAVEDLFGCQFETIMKNLENPDEPETRKIESMVLLPCHMGTQLSPVGHIHQGVKLSLDEKIVKRSDLLDRECEYSKSMRITALPLYLVVHFVRFEWKRSSDSNRTKAGKAKICRKVQFSLNFDAYEFCTDALKNELRIARVVMANRMERETANKMDDAPKSEVETKPTNEGAATPKMVSLTCGSYELVSIVTHQGRTTDSGHYVAWTKKTDKIWHKFDDDMVTEHRWQDIDLTGGRSDYHIAVLLMFRQVRFDATEEEVEEAKQKVAAEIEAAEKVKQQQENKT